MFFFFFSSNAKLQQNDVINVSNWKRNKQQMHGNEWLEMGTKMILTVQNMSHKICTHTLIIISTAFKVESYSQNF